MSCFQKIQVLDFFKNLLANAGITMIYISTNYVFDGTKPPYSEEDETNPLNTYGQTKLDGEKVTLEASSG